MSAKENELRFCRAKYIPKDSAHREERLWLRYDGYTHYVVTLEVPLQGEGYVYAHIFNNTNIRYSAELSFEDRDTPEPVGVILRAPHDHGGLTKEELPIYIEELRLARDAMDEITRRFCNGQWMKERETALKLITAALPFACFKGGQEYQDLFDANRATEEDYTLTFSVVRSTETYKLHFNNLLDAIRELMNGLHKHNSNCSSPKYSHADIKRKGSKDAVFFGTWENGRTGTTLSLSDPDFMRVTPYLSQYRD